MINQSEIEEYLTGLLLFFFILINSLYFDIYLVFIRLKRYNEVKLRRFLAFVFLCSSKFFDWLKKIYLTKREVADFTPVPAGVIVCCYCFLQRG